MKQINNNCQDYYYLEEDGRIFNKKSNKYLKINSSHSYVLKQLDGTFKQVYLKELYQKVYGRVFSKDSIEDLPDEEWREVPGTKGNYLVSSMGRVKSLMQYQTRLLRPALNKDKGGYARVLIMQDGMRMNMLVHRLVAAAFLLPPESPDFQLHHRDGNRLNNTVENLVWLSRSDHRKTHAKLLNEQEERKEKEKCQGK